MRTPICLDESLEDLAALECAIALGSLRTANIKIQRVGGFGNARRILDLCLAHKLGIWVGTMRSSASDRRRGAALGSH